MNYLVDVESRINLDLLRYRVRIWEQWLNAGHTGPLPTTRSLVARKNASRGARRDEPHRFIHQNSGVMAKPYAIICLSRIGSRPVGGCWPRKRQWGFTTSGPARLFLEYLSARWWRG